MMSCVVVDVDELAASLSQVRMGEATPTRTQEVEAFSGELEGACGGSHQDGTATLIVAECLQAEVRNCNKVQSYILPFCTCVHFQKRCIENGQV